MVLLEELPHDGSTSDGQWETRSLPPGDLNVPEYAYHELNWLQLFWGGERRFLEHHGFDYGVEADRANGRLFCRTIIQSEDEREEGTRNRMSQPIPGIAVDTQRLDASWWRDFAHDGDYTRLKNDA